MNRYILLTYSGTEITPEVISALGKVLKESGIAVKAVHGTSLSEAEVLAILAKHVSPEVPRELSPVESACIYANKRFGAYFGNDLKLVLALSEAVVNNREDKTLINAIDIIAHGVSNTMSMTYGITNEVISIFKQINQNLKNV